VGDDDSGVIRNVEDMIEVRVPARSEFGSLLRLVVASVAADQGFTVDEIDDLRLGVSEVFGTLTEAAADDDCCALRIAIGRGAVGVTLLVEDASGRRPADGSAMPPLDALSSTILASVVDEFRASDEGYMLVKRAVESAAAG